MNLLSHYSNSSDDEPQANFPAMPVNKNKDSSHLLQKLKRKISQESDEETEDFFNFEIERDKKDVKLESIGPQLGPFTAIRNGEKWTDTQQTTTTTAKIHHENEKEWMAENNSLDDQESLGHPELTESVLRKLGAPKDAKKHIDMISFSEQERLQHLADDAKNSTHRLPLLHPAYGQMKRHTIHSLYAQAKHNADAIDEERSVRMTKQRQAKSKYGKYSIDGWQDFECIK